MRMQNCGGKRKLDACIIHKLFVPCIGLLPGDVVGRQRLARSTQNSHYSKGDLDVSGSFSEFAFDEESRRFDSRDSAIVILDGPGDTTMRQTSQHLLPFLIAERERLLR
jgi:hypothetical protein